MRELGEKVQQMKSRGYIGQPQPGARLGHRNRPTIPPQARIRAGYDHASSPPQAGYHGGELALPGYQSDGSEVSSMSITSTQSERPARTKVTQ